MRNLDIGAPVNDNDFQGWVKRSFETLETAHLDGQSLIDTVSKITLGPFTPSRRLDAGSITLAGLANFIATFISDLQKAR